MSRFWILCFALVFAFILPLAASPALAQGTAIAASPNPATTADEITLNITGRGACPELAPITRSGNTFRAEIRTSCPFVPPPPEPFNLEATLDPLSAGTYQLEVVLPDDTVLATGTLEVREWEGCISTDTVVCLNEGRYTAEASFRTASGQSGEGQAIQFTDDSGLFTFFDAENVELIVKVLDRCGTAFDSTWVFSAGLTNVEVELKVTELATGQVKTYVNPLGEVFESVLDTRAFESCP